MNPLLVFDLDDTLYPERSFVLSGFRAAGEWLQSSLGVEGLEQEAVRLFAQGMRGHIFDAALTSIGCSLDVVPDLVEVYRGHRPDIALFDDAAWALAHYGAKHQLGMLTDGFLETQRRKVRALGIETSMQVIVFSDESGRACWKPNPEPYQRVMAASGRSGRECVYIADNPAKDFITAKQLGWSTIRIRRPDGEYARLEPAEPYRADAEIASFHDLASAMLHLGISDG